VDDLNQVLTSLFRKAYEQGVKDGQKINDHRFIQRKFIHDEFGIPVDSFDDFVRKKEGFPSYMFGTKPMYYIPAVNEWLMNHQQINN